MALNYGDVTGDGIEEAMMMLGIETRGSAIPEVVYIFGLEHDRPKLVWSFETGDRADGGLRQVYAEQRKTGYRIVRKGQNHRHKLVSRR